VGYGLWAIGYGLWAMRKNCHPFAGEVDPSSPGSSG